MKHVFIAFLILLVSCGETQSKRSVSGSNAKVSTVDMAAHVSDDLVEKTDVLSNKVDAINSAIEQQGSSTNEKLELAQRQRAVELKKIQQERNAALLETKEKHEAALEATNQEVKNAVDQADSALDKITALQKQLMGSNEKILKLTADLELFKASVGTDYIRWGRTDCPGVEGTTHTYTGIVVGSYFSHSGSGANYMCLSKRREDPFNFDSNDKNGGLLYSTEFQTHGHGSGDSKNLHDRGVNCAACRSSGRTSTVMIPGTQTCEPGYTKEYDGLLMAEYYTHSKSEFICVDADPHTFGETRNNENGALLYPVEIQLHQDNIPDSWKGIYTNNGEVSCVVCTR